MVASAGPCEVCGHVESPHRDTPQPHDPLAGFPQAPDPQHPGSPQTPVVANGTPSLAPAPAHGPRGKRTRLLVVGALLAAGFGLAVGLAAGRLRAADDESATTSKPSRSSVDRLVSKAGSAGTGTSALDGYLVLDDDGVHVQPSGGERTTVIDHAVAAAFDDGVGGLVYQDLRSTDRGLSSSSWDLAIEPPGSAEEGTIWHLPAGAVDPEPLLTSPDITRDWVGLVGAGPLGDRNVVVYARGAFRPELGEVEQLEASLVVRDIDSGRDLFTVPQAWGYEWGISEVSVLDDMLAYLSSGEGMSTWSFLDDELRAIEAGCSATYDVDQIDCGYGAVDEGRRIASVEYSETGESISGIRVVDLDTASDVARYPATDSPYLGEGGYTVLIDAKDGRAIVSFRPLTDGPLVPALLYNMEAPSGSEPEQLEATGQVAFLSAPLVRP